MAASLVFARYWLLSGLCLLYSRSYSLGYLIVSYCCGCYFVVGLLMLTNTAPWLLGKDVRRGTISLVNFLVFAPFHAINAVYMAIVHWVRHRKHIPVCSEIPNSGLWIGGLNAFQLEHVALRGSNTWTAVIDLCAEFPARAACTPGNYICCLTWDGIPPSLAALDACVAFAMPRLPSVDANAVPMLVHCAFGVGRSCLVCCVILLAARRAPNARAALAMVKAARPIARLNAAMTARLHEWAAQHGIPIED